MLGFVQAHKPYITIYVFLIVLQDIDVLKYNLFCTTNLGNEWIAEDLHIYITLSVMQFILYMVSFTLVNTMGPFIICIRRGYCSPCEAVEAWDCNWHAA